jgi:hypothetical protein
MTPCLLVIVDRWWYLFFFFGKKIIRKETKRAFLCLYVSRICITRMAIIHGSHSLYNVLTWVTLAQDNFFTKMLPMLKLYTNYGFHELFLNYTDVCIYLYLYIESDPSRQIWKVTILKPESRRKPRTCRKSLTNFIT